MRIWHIGGYKHSYLKGNRYSYNFSRFTQIWGWATWANRWQCYNVVLSKYKDDKNILFDYEFFMEDYENKSRVNILDRVLSIEIDTWDYQWNFTVRINTGLSIRPKVNLISNIGFGEEATHTSGNNKDIELNKAQNLTFPLKHPDFAMIYRIDDKLFGQKNLDNRFLSKIKRKLNGK